jgi:hypothetical protein
MNSATSAAVSATPCGFANVAPCPVTPVGCAGFRATLRCMGESDPAPPTRNGKLSIPLDPEEALRGLLQVKPDEPAKSKPKRRVAAKKVSRAEKRQ